MNNCISLTSRLALAVGLGCGLVASALAQAGSYDQAMRELNIMRNIFNASMQNGNYRDFGFGSGDAIYLANQGMVFTFALPGRGWLNMPDLARLQSLNGIDFDFDFDFDEARAFIGNDADGNARVLEYQQKMQEFNQVVLEKESEMRQAMSDKQNAMHDLQLEMNDKQRALRELQRQQRQGLEIDNEMERLSNDIKVLGDEIGKLGDSINESQQTHQAELRAQLATVHQAYAAQIFGTLCNYGNTLRSLGSDQHVSIVLRNHEENQSQVYVVDYNALSSCNSGESLQQAAVTYVQ